MYKVSNHNKVRAPDADRQVMDFGEMDFLKYFGSKGSPEGTSVNFGFFLD